MTNLSVEYAKQFHKYRELYMAASEIHSAFDLTNQSAFDYCLSREFFVIITPYNNRHEILAERTFAAEKIKWSLIGGSLKVCANETFLEAANRLAQFTLPSIKVSDIEPFAFLYNTFRYGEEECVHRGIAFTGRVRTDNPEKLLLTGERTRGHFVPLTLSLDQIAVSHNSKVFQEAVNYVSKKAYGEVPFHEREISINEKYQHRYTIHNRFVKPIFNVASRFVGQYSISEYKALERELIMKEGPQSLIDVACGENELCEQISKNTLLTHVVGNDISFSQIELLTKGRNTATSAESLVYTNHDATSMPFADKQFDIAICKNVLHHMPDMDAARQLVNETVRISKRALIVEVMDPHLEGKWGRLRHNYYVHFLKDAFVHFFSPAEFEEMIAPYRRDSRLDCQTFRGLYCMAIIRKS